MKRKYILVAAALAVLCAGVAAYSMNQNTELPSSTPNSSSAPASVASSEPESGSTSVTDNRDIAKAENFVAYQVFSQETATGTDTDTSGDGQVNVSGDVKEGSAWIKRYMSKYNVSEEEATAAYQEYASGAQQNREEAQQKREEYNQKIQAETQAHLDAIDKWYRENTGMSRADWTKMTIAEKSEWMFAHPDVDFSTSPEYQ